MTSNQSNHQYAFYFTSHTRLAADRWGNRISDWFSKWKWPSVFVCILYPIISVTSNLIKTHFTWLLFLIWQPTESPTDSVSFCVCLYSIFVLTSNLIIKTHFTWLLFLNRQPTESLTDSVSDPLCLSVYYIPYYICRDFKSNHDDTFYLTSLPHLHLAANRISDPSSY